MTPLDPREEEELRRLVRRELEARERLESERAGERRGRSDEPELSEQRRRIIEQEVEAFYREKGYERYENDEGEIEWLSPAELRDRMGQLPVDMEELEVEQKRVRNRFMLILLLAFCGVVLLFLIARDRTGSIQVISNVPGATVLLNGSATEFATDCRLDHVPVGPHMIGVSKYGYVPDGPATVRVDLRAGETEVVVLRLKPQRVDSVGRSN